MSAQPPLIAHVVHHFDVGGLENGMVNLINRIPEGRYRHAIICMRGYTDFGRRIHHPDVKFFALEKKPGKDFRVYGRMARVLRELRPDIVHTRNLSGLEGQFVAAACGVPARIHGEHGRDGFDLHGKNRKYNLLRKLARPLVHRYIALSRDLQRWLIESIGVAPEEIAQIYNGVDIDRFHPRVGDRGEWGPEGFVTGDEIVIGSVGRMAAVKDFPTLVQAFLDVVALRPGLRARLRLAIVGEGGSRAACQAMATQAGAENIVWFPGERADVPELIRGFDMLVLPSLGEGISNTILEAMASGLPVLATHVGGNPELVEESVTGRLIPPGNPDALAQALLDYVDDPARLARQGAAARARVEAHFSMDAMVRGYLGVYDEVLAQRSRL